MQTNIKTFKISRYTFLFENNNRYFIFNSLSNASLEIDEELFLLLKKHKENHSYIIEPLEEQVVEMLIKNNVITKNDEDDFLTYKSISLLNRQSNHNIILTIAPTMDCCFNCHYCFERTKKPTYMSDNVMKGITKFLGKFENIKNLNLTWFGGEPLMAVPEMENLYRKLRRKLKGISFHSSIITTGFHLTEENIKALQIMKVTNMQITLDGLKETHNKIKFTEGCDDAFSQVLTNLDKTCDIAPEIHIVIRTNLTKSNAHEYQELQQIIHTRYKGKNVNIAPAIVLDRDNCGKTTESDLFTATEFPLYILKLAHQGIDSPQIRYPDFYFNECAIRNPYSFSFDPEGYVYKCWEHIGNTKYAIGKINKNGVMENVDGTLLNRQLYGADPLDDPTCRKCPYLPICHGGCPIQRIENKFNDGKNVCCTYYKGHIDEFILEHIRRKEFTEKTKNNA